MRCESCEKIVKELALDNEHYETTTIQTWHPFIHKNLLNYADYNNGVSEGGGAYGCKTCFTMFEDHYHMAMEEDEVFVELKKHITEEDVRHFAHFIVIQEQADQLKSELQTQNKIKVYTASDLFVPYTFNYQTEEEHSYMLLEMQQKYGFNHKTYSNYPHVSLSFEELISDFGSNDDYVKKAFILTFDAKADDIRIFASSSPYAAPSVTVAFSKYVEPKDLYVVNPETMEEKPLTDMSIDACKQRNHEVFLEVIRTLRTRFKKEDTPLTIDKRVEEKVHFIKRNLNAN